MKSKLLGLSLLLIAFFSSCSIQNDLDDFDDSYHPDIAVPLLRAKTSLKDIVKSGNANALRIDPDGQMRLYYKGTVSERKAKDALKIFPSSGVPIAYKDTIFKLPFKSDLYLYHVIFPSTTVMNLGCQVLSMQAEQIIDGYILVPGLTKNGVPFRYDFSQKMKSGSNALFGSFNLDGYKLNFDNGSELTFEYRAKTKATGEIVQLSILGLIQNVGFKYCEAFMKKQPLELDAGVVNLDFYEEQEEGDLKFEDPRITVIVENSYGFPMRTDIKFIKSINAKNDTVILNAKGLTDGGFDFPYPDLAKNEIGQTKTFKYDFTKQSSNIKDMLNSKPTRLFYDIDVIANPNEVTIPGFVTDTTNLKISVEVDIPFYGSAKNFKIKQDFAEINFAEALSSIQEAELKIFAENELPVGVNLEVDFIDKNDKILTQLSAGKPIAFIEPALIDATGAVKNKSISSTTIPFDRTKTDLLRQCEKVQLRYFISTSNNGTVPVKVLASQNINIGIGVKAKL